MRDLRSTAVVCWLIAVVAVSACATDRGSLAGRSARDGGQASLEPDASSSDAAVSDDAGAAGRTSETAMPKLCDGSEALRLAHWSEPANASVGQAVLLERGGMNLYVDGQCRAWVRANEWAELRALKLSDEDARKLGQALMLTTWSSLEQKYCIDVTDLGPLAFYFAPKLVVISGCNTLPEPPFDVWKAMRAEITALSQRAAPVTGGSVRYLLETVANAAPETARGGAPWPLDNLEDAARLNPDDRLPMIQNAEGEAADKLRALRKRYIDGEIGSYPLSGIPIVQADGRTFMLYVRDVSSWENTADTIAQTSTL